MMGSYVYLLRHTYEYGDELDHEATKELGIYSSYENARQAIQRYMVLEGFCKYPMDCFIISEYAIDKDSEWLEGFTTWEEIEHYQEANNICRDDQYKNSIYRNDTTDNKT